MATAPAAVNVIVVAGGVASVVGQCLHKVVEWQCHLGQIGRKGGPIVLFEVDVHGVVTAPRRPEMGCPQSLQVGRNARSARAADEQVTAILEIKGLQIAVVGARSVAFEVGIVFEHLLRIHIVVECRTAETELHTGEETAIVGHMADQQLVVGIVHQMPRIIGSHVDIVGSLADRMLVETVETGLIDNVDDGLSDTAELQGGIDHLHVAVAVFHLQHGAIVDAVFRIARGMAEHGELVLAGFHAMGHLRGEHQSTIERLFLAGCEPYGNHLVGIRGPILALEAHAIALKSGAADGTVEAELPVIAGGCALVVVVDEQCGQRLVVLRVVSLHMPLERVGQLVVLTKQCLAYLGNPLAGSFVLVAVNGAARPERDIVQMEHVLVGTAIHQRAQLAVANGQRLLEIVGGTVVPQRHRQLLLRTGKQCADSQYR